MKKAVFLLACLGIPFFSSAQKPEQPEIAFLLLKGGLARPTGNFGEKSLNAEAGLADPGFLAAVELGTYFNRYIGASMMAGLRRNSADLAVLNQRPGSHFYPLNKWRTNFFMVNVLVQYPVSSGFSVYGKLGPGVTGNTYPGISTNPTATSDQPKIKGDAFAIGFGGGFTWHLDGYSLGLEAYSLRTSPAFQTVAGSFQQDMHTLNYNFNLGFRIR